MATINISLPAKLKDDADLLVKQGFYVSFSDLVRDALRRATTDAKYAKLYSEAKGDLKKGRAVVLKNRNDVDNFFKKI